MLRYRIARHPDGRYMVLAAPLSIFPIDQTYATRAQAQDAVDWINSQRENDLALRHEAAGVCRQV